MSNIVRQISQRYFTLLIVQCCYIRHKNCLKDNITMQNIIYNGEAIILAVRLIELRHLPETEGAVFNSVCLYKALY